MSRIAIVVHADASPVDADLFPHLCGGPAATWREGAVGLAWGGWDLRDADSAPPAPLESADGRYVLVADARLDNRDELARALGIRISRRDVFGDAQLLLAAHERWLDQAPRHLLGDFAYIVWDRRERCALVVRDQIGIRQISYFHANGVFVCASEPARIVTHPRVENKVDEATLGAYLIDRFDDPEATLYAGVRRVPPAHVLHFNGTPQLRRYWDAAEVAPLGELSYEEIVERFRDVFSGVIASSLDGPAPVAATLSGGLDSSAIVCQAAQLGYAARVRAYSLTFEGLSCDESPFIDAVETHSGVPVVRCPRPVASLPLALDPQRPLDVPCDVTFSMNEALLTRAHADGARVVLWGLGGDEMLSSGDAYLRDFARLHRWRALAAATRDRVLAEGLAGARAVLRTLAPQSVRDFAAQLPGRAATVPEWIAPEFLARHPQLAQPAPRLARRFDAWTQQSIWEGLVAGRSLSYGLPGLDALAHSLSLEFRYPFFDRRIVEFILGLRTSYVELLASKLLLREALYSTLPNIVRDRLSKAAFESQIDLEIEQQYATIKTLAERSELALAGYVRGACLRALSGHSPCDNLDRYRGAIVRFARSEMWLRASHNRSI